MKLGRTVQARAEVLMGELLLRDSAMLGNEVKKGPEERGSTASACRGSHQRSTVGVPFQAERAATARVQSI